MMSARGVPQEPQDVADVLQRIWRWVTRRTINSIA